MWQIARRAIRWIDHNSQNILTAGSLIGLVLTVKFAWDESPEVLKLIDQEEEIRGVELTRLEKLKVATPKCWKTILSGVITGGLIIGATLTGNHKQAVLTGALMAGEQLMQDYKTKHIEMIGEKKEREIQEAVNRDRMHRDVGGIHDLAGIIRTGNGDELFYEAWTGRLFLSSETSIRKGVNEANYYIQGNDYMSLEEFYMLPDINLPSTDASRIMGFNNKKPISISIDWNDWNEKVYRILYYNNPPLTGFDKL